ncbi:MAG: TonB-dependent receptor [Gemmatimonadota bacterium]|nr:TonB-dependent receptor [Gemmatimonadota bacterium]
MRGWKARGARSPDTRPAMLPTRAGLLAALALVTSVIAAPLAAQKPQEVALLRGQTGVEPEPGSLLATPAGLTVGQLPLAAALTRLSERSRVQIAFSPSLLPTGHQVACECATLNIARALDHMLEGTELGYVELGPQVIVVPLAPPEAPRFDATIRGRVRTEVAIPLEDATAILRPAGDSTGERMAFTDGLGFFAFHDLAAGAYELTVGRLGYAGHDEAVTVAPGGVVEVGIALAVRPVPVEGIQVDGLGERDRARFRESAAGAPMEMDRAGVRSIPGAAEADPVRTVDALPGVTRVSEIGASFNVRGGSADQNLVLLDGVPIFNPFHMLGIFSVFNADMVKRTQLRSGGFAPEYGGRASSVLLVESDLGDGKFGVDAGLSLLTARLSVSGGLPEEVRDGFGLAAARWRISGRRSYADVLANPFLSADFPYHLRDRQFGFEAWTRGGSRLGITYYSGTDAFNLTAYERLEHSTRNQELHPEQDVTWRWGNRALGFSWTRPGSNGGSLDVHGSYSRFEGDFNLSEFGSPMLETAIRRLSLGADLEVRPTAAFRWKSGLGLEALEHSDESRGELESLVRSGRSTGLGASAYSQFNWSPNPRWLMEGGLRLDHWFDSGTSTSPRIALKRFLWDGRWAVRLDAGRYVQFLQSVRDESLPIALDSWVLAGNEVTPLVSRQFQGGLEGFFGTDDEWFASAVGFHRGYEGLATRNWADDPGVRSDDFKSGTGRSFGAEFLLRRGKGATKGWVSVSLLKATRKFPHPGRAGIDNIVPAVEYAPAFDRRLALDLVVQRRLPWSVEGGLRWSFGTGLPFTRHATYSVNPRRMIDLRPGGREQVVWLGPRNGERYPAHHRLDISLRKVIRKRWGVVTPWLNVLNVYNRRNVVLFYEYIDYYGQTGRRGLSLVPILPTLGVEVSF